MSYPIGVSELVDFNDNDMNILNKDDSVTFERLAELYEETNDIDKQWNEYGSDCIGKNIIHISTKDVNYIFVLSGATANKFFYTLIWKK